MTTNRSLRTPYVQGLTSLSKTSPSAERRRWHNLSDVTSWQSSERCVDDRPCRHLYTRTTSLKSTGASSYRQPTKFVERRSNVITPPRCIVSFCTRLLQYHHYYYYYYCYCDVYDFLRLRNDLYCVEWDVKLYYNIPCMTFCIIRKKDWRQGHQH